MQGWKLIAAALGVTAASLAGGQAIAQAKNSLVMAMTLEPPGLDPTIAPAAAIGEVVH